MATLAQVVANPKVTLDIVTRDQNVGLQEQRALVVGQMLGATKATGKITFTGNPTAADTVTFNGTSTSFVASGATGTQTNIGGTLALTLAAWAAMLNASADTQLAKFKYYVVGNALVVVAVTGGTAGNALTLAKSCSVATLSAATLAGGAAATATATAGVLTQNVSVTRAEINSLFGTGSHIALAAYGFRDVNAVTILDALALADAANSISASAQVVGSGTVTQAGSFFVSVVDQADHTYQIDLVTGDTMATFLTLLAAAIDADVNMPFTYATDTTSAMMFLAKSAGQHANTWLLAVKGTVPGLTLTLTGWAGGATNPSLTTLFDPIANLRYQTIIWPEVYSLSKVSGFLDARKNVDNDVMDGRAFTYHSVSKVQAQTDALGVNSSEVVILNNVPTSAATWIGPHIPAAPDALAAKFAGARSRRFETDISIADIVATNEANDQFGGDDKASLPYFNTPILGVGLPMRGTGHLQSEQDALSEHGVSVVGMNRSMTAVVMGVTVTTWLADTAGNPDDTWKFLEWRDSHGAIREYLVLNLRKRFAQYRLTIGDAVANYSMANEAMIRGYILEKCQDLMGMTLIVAGQPSRQFIQNNLSVVLYPAQRKVTVALTVPLVSQLGAIYGTVKFNFSTI